MSRLIQRVGRSGHKIGQTSKGLIITQDSDDTLEAIVLCRRSLLGLLEPLVPFKNANDAAIHQIAGLLVETSSWRLEDMYSLIRSAYPYSTLSLESLKNILAYMRDRYPKLLHFAENDNIVKRARDFKPLFDYYFENLSMIPDEKQYIVIGEGDRPVGVLDEAFVSEYGQVGVKFVEAGRCWKILEIYENKVYVAPEEDPSGAVPSWVGDEIPVPLEVALEVGSIRREYAEHLSNSRGEAFIERLCREYPIEAHAASVSLKEVVEQHAMGLHIPSDRLVTIERWDRYVIIQASFGHKVNRVLARVVAHIVSERLGQSVAVHQDPYRIILEVDASPELVRTTLLGIVDKDLGELARVAVERSGIFKRRLIHAGKKCGAIAKEADYASVSISGLIEALRGTPVYDEAISVIFHDDFDVEAAREVLLKIRAKEIGVELLESEGISPLAQIGVEEVSRRGEIVSPERLRAIIRQSTEARVIDGFLIAVCTNCWDYVEPKRIGSVEMGACPKCGHDSVGFSTESYETIFSLALKARSRTDLHGKSLKMVEILKKSAALHREYGSDALVLMGGRGIRLDGRSGSARQEEEGGRRHHRHRNRGREGGSQETVLRSLTDTLSEGRTSGPWTSRPRPRARTAWSPSGSRSPSSRRAS